MNAVFKISWTYSSVAILMLMCTACLGVDPKIICVYCSSSTAQIDNSNSALSIVARSDSAFEASFSIATPDNPDGKIEDFWIAGSSFDWELADGDAHTSIDPSGPGSSDSTDFTAGARAPVNTAYTLTCAVDAMDKYGDLVSGTPSYAIDIKFSNVAVDSVYVMATPFPGETDFHVDNSGFSFKIDMFITGIGLDQVKRRQEISSGTTLYDFNGFQQVPRVYFGVGGDYEIYFPDHAYPIDTEGQYLVDGDAWDWDWLHGLDDFNTTADEWDTQAFSVKERNVVVGGQNFTEIKTSDNSRSFIDYFQNGNTGDNLGQFAWGYEWTNAGAHWDGAPAGDDCAGPSELPNFSNFYNLNNITGLP
ncbi:MAG TPA: hypothetical protein VH253_08190 [Phycisphaerae bacterium]|nr:hypothetical protein [Phycisphaerae bacterium]